MSTALFEHIGRIRIVPVIEIDRADRAVGLAEALSEGGLPIMEVMLRTEAALDAIGAVVEALPDFLVGAGSLVTPDQVKAVAALGAKFGVSPGHSRLLSDTAEDVGIPFVPGVVTASEMIAALQAGRRHLKFFPAEAFGGVKAIKSLVAPFSTAGVKIMPTGGVSPDNMTDYLSIPEVFAVGGSWIATRQQIVDGEFKRITEAARRAVALVSDH